MSKNRGSVLSFDRDSLEKTLIRSNSVNNLEPPKVRGALKKTKSDKHIQ